MVGLFSLAWWETPAGGEKGRRIMTHPVPTPCSCRRGEQNILSLSNAPKFWLQIGSPTPGPTDFNVLELTRAQPHLQCLSNCLSSHFKQAFPDNFTSKGSTHFKGLMNQFTTALKSIHVYVYSITVIATNTSLKAISLHLTDILGKALLERHLYPLIPN